MAGRTLLGTLAAAAIALVPANAGAQTFGAPVKLVGPTGSPAPVVVAASANGFEGFAWTRFGAVVRGGVSSWVQVRLRLPNGRLTPIESVSSKSGRAFLPAVGVDRAGDVTVAWFEQIRGRNLALEVSVRPAGKGFTTPAVLGDTRVSACCGTFNDGTPGVLAEGNLFGVGPVLAVTPDGAAVVAWEGASSMQVAARPRGRCSVPAARACFSATQSLPAGLQPNLVPSDHPGAAAQIAFGPGGTAYLVWAAPAGLEVAVAKGGHHFGPATEISAGTQLFTTPAIAVTGGDAVIAWHWGLTHSGGTEMVVRDPSGTISTPLQLGSGGGEPSILIAPHGQALIDWPAGDDSGYLYEAVRAADGTVGPTTVVGTFMLILAGPMTRDPIIIDGNGNEVLCYEAGPDQETFWQLRLPGGTFGAPSQVPSSVNGSSFLVLRTPNVVTIGWHAADGTMLADIRLGPSS